MARTSLEKEHKHSRTLKKIITIRNESVMNKLLSWDRSLYMTQTQFSYSIYFKLPCNDHKNQSIIEVKLYRKIGWTINFMKTWNWPACSGKQKEAYHFFPFLLFLFLLCFHDQLSAILEIVLLLRQFPVELVGSNLTLTFSSFWTFAFHYSLLYGLLLWKHALFFCWSHCISPPLDQHNIKQNRLNRTQKKSY